MTERCENCRFARAYDPPEGPMPEVQEIEPVKWWEVLSPVHPSVVADRLNKAWSAHLSWTQAKHFAEHKVQCRCLPTPVQKNKTDWCGQWESAK